MERAAHLLEAWGKLDFNADSAANAVHGEPVMHSLSDHMMDVAACFIEIVREGTRLREALHSTARRVLTKQDIERLAVLVYLHDFGKANSGFQAKRWRDGAPRGWPRRAGHGAEALMALTIDELRDRLPIDSLLAWGNGVNDLLLATLAHHGRPVADPIGHDPYVWRPVRDHSGNEVYNPAQALNKIVDRLRCEFKLAFEPGGALLPSSPAFAHLFAGLVQLADWLGSDRQKFFKFSEAGVQRTRAHAHKLAENAVAAVGLDPRVPRRTLRARSISFETAFALPAPNAAQAALGGDALGPLVILESATGSGKTEAALWRFFHLFQSGKVDSLYFALPTRVAAVQLYERVRTFVARLWPVDAPVVVRALSGYESADGSDKIALPDFKVQWSDNADDAKASTRWAAESPKRFLAATIAVGTIDQVLLAALKVRHAHLRHALLSRSLLVVDEVHASDTYMSQLLEDVLKTHLATGGHALLLSATLGSRQRERFKQIARGLPVDEPSIGIEEACAQPYPALTDGSPLKKLPASGKPKTICWNTLDKIDDYDHVAQLAVDAATQGARVLIVRNTVSAAIATQKTVEALVDQTGKREWLFDVNGVATLHHSRFSRQDRPLLDARVEARLGKTRNGLSACIVVGTQTLEQSLDIDADLLITDICPMDVLLQRIGRLHRHAREEHERPAAFREPRAWVLTPERESFDAYIDKPRHGLGRLRNGGGVYPDLRMIDATWQLIAESKTRVIPLDNRELVERATHRDCLASIENARGPFWKALGQALEGTDSAERAIARNHTLPYEKPFEELTFPGADERIATRLGTADRLIDFHTPVRGPFGIDVQRIAVPHHLIPRETDLDAKAVDIELNVEGFEFTFGAARFRYGRFGLEKSSRNATPQGAL